MRCGRRTSLPTPSTPGLPSARPSNRSTTHGTTRLTGSRGTSVTSSGTKSSEPSGAIDLGEPGADGLGPPAGEGPNGCHAASPHDRQPRPPLTGSLLLSRATHFSNRGCALQPERQAAFRVGKGHGRELSGDLVGRSEARLGKEALFLLFGRRSYFLFGFAPISDRRSLLAG